jgi:DNA topoisomerase-1
MANKLLIVESPAKAKTIGKYLSNGFVVKSSVGHIRDLPKENGAITINEEGPEKWSFSAKYVVPEGKSKVVSSLKAAAKEADEIYLASDPDREGEAIAWHLREVLSPVAKGKKFHRVTYNEITKSAVVKAVENPREINMPLVDAQQARRILDRLVGYRISPLLWKNINCPNNRTLSAGRVQSVALRLLVERQREIEAFTPETYFLLGVEAKAQGDSKSFVAKLARLDGEKPSIRDKDSANVILLDLYGSSLVVGDVKERPKMRHALAPFTTSSLQQAASSVLGYSPGKTMKLAQSLYEHGHITYMRTDSVAVSKQAQSEAKEYIISSFGEQFYPDTPNVFQQKAKAGVQAQEAHEAIRPTKVTLTPDKSDLEAQELKLYDLIWRRFVASQMADARTLVRTICINAEKPGMAHKYEFTASATIIEFEGFLRVMKLSLKKKKADNEEDEDSDEVAYLPNVAKSDTLEFVRWLSDEKQTKGPSHYSEASLIKALEENGVGRPSTYAATIETLKLREYATNEKKKLVPLERGILVCDWLVKKMEDLFSVGYTAKMEAELDCIEEKGTAMNDMLSAFYSKLKKEIEESSDPPPDRSKFDAIFAMLDQVKEWKSAKKVGNRLYDDKAFVESVKKQAEENEKPLTHRQLQSLMRVASWYHEQIPDFEARMAASGMAVQKSQVTFADPELVKYCFAQIDQIPELQKNRFLISVREQVDHGRSLSQKQLSVVASAILEKASELPDPDAVRLKLSDFAGSNLKSESSDDPAVAELLKMLKQVKTFRPATRFGKKVYDDKSFSESLMDQYSRRGKLSERQISALKRIVRAYRTQIPDYDAKKDALGLEGGEKDGAAKT